MAVKAVWPELELDRCRAALIWSNILGSSCTLAGEASDMLPPVVTNLDCYDIAPVMWPVSEVSVSYGEIQQQTGSIVS